MLLGSNSSPWKPPPSDKRVLNVCYAHSTVLGPWWESSAPKKFSSALIHKELASVQMRFSTINVGVSRTRQKGTCLQTVERVSKSCAQTVFLLGWLYRKCSWEKLTCFSVWYLGDLGIIVNISVMNPLKCIHVHRVVRSASGCGCKVVGVIRCYLLAPVTDCTCDGSKTTFQAAQLRGRSSQMAPRFVTCPMGTLMPTLCHVRPLFQRGVLWSILQSEDALFCQIRCTPKEDSLYLKINWLLIDKEVGTSLIRNSYTHTCIHAFNDA